MSTNDIIVKLLPSVGTFAENKDIAKALREKDILPPLRLGRNLILDFTGVTNTTQSFTHALISEAIREHGIDVLDRITFKGCNPTVKNIVGIVTDYMQFSED